MVAERERTKASTKNFMSRDDLIYNEEERVSSSDNDSSKSCSTLKTSI
jgi:hypothetical protein